MRLTQELIENYEGGIKICVLSKKYGIEYNTLYFKLGELAIRRREKPGGYRGGYRRNSGRKKNQEIKKEKSQWLKERHKENTRINQKYEVSQPKGMKVVKNDPFKEVSKYVNDYWMGGF